MAIFNCYVSSPEGMYTYLLEGIVGPCFRDKSHRQFTPSPHFSDLGTNDSWLTFARTQVENLCLGYTNIQITKW